MAPQDGIIDVLLVIWMDQKVQRSTGEGRGRNLSSGGATVVPL